MSTFFSKKQPASETNQVFVHAIQSSDTNHWLITHTLKPVSQGLIERKSWKDTNLKWECQVMGWSKSSPLSGWWIWWLRLCCSIYQWRYATLSLAFKDSYPTRSLKRSRNLFTPPHPWPYFLLTTHIPRLSLRTTNLQ